MCPGCLKGGSCMTVKELISELNAYPQDMEVLRGDSEYGAFKVEEISFAENFHKRCATVDITKEYVLLDLS